MEKEKKNQTEVDVHPFYAYIESLIPEGELVSELGKIPGVSYRTWRRNSTIDGARRTTVEEVMLWGEYFDIPDEVLWKLLKRSFKPRSRKGRRKRVSRMVRR